MTPLLDIRDLHVVFDTDAGRLQAVEGVSLLLDRGESLGLVGESGCGKSVTALSVSRLIPAPSGRIIHGSIRFDGQDLLLLPIDAMRRLRGRRIAMIFQDPMTALSPLHRIRRQLEEVLRIHRPAMPSGARRSLAVEWLGRVGIPDPAQAAEAFPHQFSGGMQQRVMIAMAMILDPDLLIADEPTTALDVTVQAQVLQLMRRLSAKHNAALLLITHDIGVVWQMCSRIAVMYAGQIVERAGADALFHEPAHPYTRALLSALPSRNTRGTRLTAIQGQAPSALRYPAGCRFHDRCPLAFTRCGREAPPLYRLGADRQSRCFLHDPAGTAGRPPCNPEVLTS